MFFFEIEKLNEEPIGRHGKMSLKRTKKICCSNFTRRLSKSKQKTVCERVGYMLYKLRDG